MAGAAGHSGRYDGNEKQELGRARCRVVGGKRKSGIGRDGCNGCSGASRRGGRPEVIARLRLWWRIMGLRADIAGYEDDLETIRMIHQPGSFAERSVVAALTEARTQLYLCTRRHPAIKQGSKA